MKPKAIFNWSSGKDSALALYSILHQGHYDVIGLLTSISLELQRVTMHGVPVSFVEKQAESLGMNLIKIELPKVPSMEEYAEIMHQSMRELQSQDVTHSIFGDIFLEDLRQYREDQLKSVGMKGVFPLWKKNTAHLIHEFLELGFKTIVTCVNEAYLDKSFVGRIIDQEFIQDLPKNVDPCGENGEFHTFTFDGPIFSFPIPIKVGEIVKKSYPNPSSPDQETIFWFCDLI